MHMFRFFIMITIFYNNILYKKSKKKMIFKMYRVLSIYTFIGYII